MDAWQKAFRDGIAPSLCTDGLLALRQALVEDDIHLIQGATTSPPPDWNFVSLEVEAACAIGFCEWKAHGGKIGDVEAAFAKICKDADDRLGMPGGSRIFLSWFDDTPRDIMRPALIAEIDAVLASRESAAASSLSGTT